MVHCPIERILGCFIGQNSSWAGLAFDVEGPFCFGDNGLVISSEPRAEAGVLAAPGLCVTSKVGLLQEGFVRDAGPPSAKPGL